MIKSGNESGIETRLCQEIHEEQHFHPELEILYVIDGELRVSCDDAEYAMRKDDILVINSNNSHALHSKGHSGILRIYVDFQILQNLISDDNFVFVCNSAAEKNQTFEEVRYPLYHILFSYVGPKKKTEALRWGYTYELLDILIEHFRPVEWERDPTRDRLQRIINYVNQNYREQINLGRLAEQMYTSTSSLSRLFKKNMGCYFGDFVNQVRLNSAVRELAKTDKTVTKIAMDCGFASLAAFNKQFQSSFGMPPTAYRRQKDEETKPNAEHILAGLEQEIQKLKREAETTHQQKEQYATIKVQIGEETPYRHPWNQILNVGSTYELSAGNVQQHIVQLYEDLKFRYVRIWNMFSSRMMLRQDTNTRQCNYHLLDNILDFLVNHKMALYFDFGEHPVCAVKSETEMVYYDEEIMEFKDADDWLTVFREFLEHIIRRYRREIVSQWIFDFSVDIRTGACRSCADVQESYQLYQRFYQAIKRSLPEAQVGGIGAAPNIGMEQIADWLKFCRNNECEPDFLSILVFPYLGMSENETHLTKRTGQEHDEARQIHGCRELLDTNGLQDCKLYVTEWNVSLSTRNWLNDSCFRAAYAVHTLCEAWDCADAMGIWMASDWCNSYYDTVYIANGGNGMLTQNGIQKPIYHAISFLNRLYTRHVQHGNYYIVTTNGRNSFYLLCCNFKKLAYSYYQMKENELDIRNLPALFTNTEDMDLQIVLDGLADGQKYSIKQRCIHEEGGSLLGEWGKFDYELNLQDADVQYLKNTCVPKLTMWKQVSSKGKLEFHAVLKAHEVTLFHISREDYD